MQKLKWIGLGACLLLLVGCGAQAVAGDFSAPAQQVGAEAAEETPESAAKMVQIGQGEAGDRQAALLSLLLAQAAANAQQPIPETENSGPELVGSQSFTEEQFAQLQELCTAQGNRVSVWARDLTTGDTFSYNTNQAYYAASTLKAPYALWLCLQADAGKLDLEEEIPNLYRWQLAGTSLANYNADETLPARVAMLAMLAHSDNNATTMLMSRWPGTASTGFTDFLEQLGFSQAEGCNMTAQGGIEGYVTARDGAATMQALYTYFESAAENADFLRQVMCQADHTALYIPAEVEAAKKYGSWELAFHDEAIVYAAHPYILVCYTSMGSQNTDFPPDAVAFMQQLGAQVYADLCG